MKNDRTEIFQRLRCSDDERLTVSRALDRLSQCENRGAPTHTDFMSPRETELVREALGIVGKEDGFVFFGGCFGAERQIAAFLPDYIDADSFEDSDANPVRAVRCEYGDTGTPTHRDFLGSLMGLGLSRGVIGDISVGDGTCDIFALDRALDFILENFVSAGRARFKPKRIELWEASASSGKTEEIRDTVASLRLDSVLAAGFRISRGKAAALIESGKVEACWQECRRADRLLSEGDCVTARGYGRIELAEVGGLSKKGRVNIVVRRCV
jgi:RNA-binding protein YlmH